MGKSGQWWQLTLTWGCTDVVLAKLPPPKGLHTNLETLAGYFVLSIFCESLIVDPYPFPSKVNMGLSNLG
jgi:hypothetical protein